MTSSLEMRGLQLRGLQSQGMDYRNALLATVASLYYKKHQSQSKIASQLEMSTSTVSRLLDEALEKGIVEIHVHMPIPRDLDLEQALIEHFALKDAYVLQTSELQANEHSDDALLNAIGKLAATYLGRVIDSFSPGSSVGVSWGSGVHAAIKALPDEFAKNIDVVQLVGGVGALVIDSPELGRMIAEKLGGRHYDLHAPVMVESKEVRKMFLKEPSVREGVVRAKAVKLAILGISATSNEASSYLRAGLFSRAQLSSLRAQGAIGEICGHFFDAEGKFDHLEINERIIGLDLNDLRQIPQSVAVARGSAKVAAILGALRGKFVRVLATDDATAEAILELEGKAVVRSQ
jgi:deoxyribonucleoside regulator